MNPLFQIIIGMLLRSKRTCPHCKREQVVPPARAGNVIRCKFCGKPMTPAADPGR